MFGVDDFISGLVGGGIKMLQQGQQNQFSREQAAEQTRLNQIAQRQEQDYNAQQAELNRQFGAQQADVARDFSAQSQREAETFNASQAELNRSFQERMSSTAYQRSRADMLAAGLNPILAANAGGASTPGGSAGSIGAVGGAMASGSAASARSIPGVAPGQSSLLEGVVTSAGELARLQPSINVLRSEDALKRSSADERASAAELNRIQSTLTDQKVKTEQETTKFVREQTANEQRKQGQVFGVNVPFWAQGAQSAGRDLMGSAQRVFDRGDRALQEMSNSAVQMLRGIWGPGTGGM